MAEIHNSFGVKDLSTVARPPSQPLVSQGGVFVQEDMEDTQDLSDLTSHQVEHSFPKHDLKCAGPRANAAVTAANWSCRLLGQPMRADSRGVPKTNHCCVFVTLRVPAI